MTIIIPIIIGIAIVVVIARTVSPFALELALIGAIIGMIENYRFWISDIFGLPPLPEFIKIISAAMIFTWGVVVLSMVLSRFNPLFRIPSTIIRGE